MLFGGVLGRRSVFIVDLKDELEVEKDGCEMLLFNLGRKKWCFYRVWLLN